MTNKVDATNLSTLIRVLLEIQNRYGDMPLNGADDLIFSVTREVNMKANYKIEILRHYDMEHAYADEKK